MSNVVAIHTTEGIRQLQQCNWALYALTSQWPHRIGTRQPIQRLGEQCEHAEQNTVPLHAQHLEQDNELRNQLCEGAEDVCGELQGLPHDRLTSVPVRRVRELTLDVPLLVRGDVEARVRAERVHGPPSADASVQRDFRASLDPTQEIACDRTRDSSQCDMQEAFSVHCARFYRNLCLQQRLSNW